MLSFGFDPPGEATDWTAAMMAKAVGISTNSVQRIWRGHGLQQHCDDANHAEPVNSPLIAGASSGDAFTISSTTFIRTAALRWSSSDWA
jgi:hypothetical protein